MPPVHRAFGRSGDPESGFPGGKMKRRNGFFPRIA
jgi:hypothetical protein